jgi:hypothetical protein
VADGGLIEFQGASNPESKPFVIVVVNGEQFGQLTPRDAALMGLRAMEASIEAERDAGFYAYAQEILGLTPEEAGHMLAGVREHREQWEQKP